MIDGFNNTLIEDLIEAVGNLIGWIVPEKFSSAGRLRKRQLLVEYFSDQLPTIDSVEERGRLMILVI